MIQLFVLRNFDKPEIDQIDELIIYGIHQREREGKSPSGMMGTGFEQINFRISHGDW
jgi:hypothetical protein